MDAILFDIETVDGITLYREFAAELQRAYASSGGHASWTESDSEAEAFEGAI